MQCRQIEVERNPSYVARHAVQGLSIFGNGFMSKFEAASCPDPLLDNITLVDTPGMFAAHTCFMLMTNVLQPAWYDKQFLSALQVSCRVRSSG